jgi:predicted  nucleic acid-binding Zn-ribbon protein
MHTYSRSHCKNRQIANLAKVDLLYFTHALRKRGLFEIVENDMERAVALKKLGKLLGKSMGYQVDPKAPDRDDRAEALARLKEERPTKEALSKQMAAREAELLKADAEYQRLKAEYAEARKRCEELSYTANRYRFTAGTMGQLFFSVKAQGDSWEEVIAKIEKERVAA